MLNNGGPRGPPFQSGYKMRGINYYVKQAQMTIDELAYAAGVSRVTASKWVNNRSKPHALIRKRISRLLGRIRVAVDEGKLPSVDDDRVTVRARVANADGTIKLHPIYVRPSVMKALDITLPS